MKKAAGNLGRILIVASIVWMLHNYYSNWHYHRLPNGVLVVHAHPFSAEEHSKTPFPVDNHKHECSQFLMIDSNSVMFFFTLFILAIVLHFVVKKENRLFKLLFLHNAFYDKYFHLRAPPVSL